MKLRRLVLSLLVPASVLIMSACTQLNNLLGNPTSPSNTSSSSSTTDVFSGSLGQNSSIVFTFSVASAGNVAITLTTVSPAATGPLGLGVGSSSNGTCTITNGTSAATAATSPQLSATENPGTYCVMVSDAGSLTATSTVTVTVTHF